MRTRGPLLLGVTLVALALFGSLWFLSLRSGQQVLVPEPPAELAADPLAVRLPRGEVAIALRVNLAAGAGSTVRRGDRVDAYVFFPAQRPGREAMTRLFLQDTLVYGSAPSGDASALTLAMPLSEALLLQHAMQLGGKPFVVLRSGQGARASPAPERLSDADLPGWVRRQEGQQRSDGIR